MKYQKALLMADYSMLYRFVIKEKAQAMGYYASFMPKPIFGVNGSGMHTHQSLFKGDVNAFHDPTAKYHISDMARSYIAGLLTHIIGGEIIPGLPIFTKGREGFCIVRAQDMAVVAGVYWKYRLILENPVTHRLFLKA